jgi:hypothetical protein
VGEPLQAAFDFDQADKNFAQAAFDSAQADICLARNDEAITY